MAIAFTFPGQGSQQVGMGADLAKNFSAAREVFDTVDDALGEKLSQIMWTGAEDELRLTRNAQPALMAVSMAVMRVLEKEKGFSLAERVKYVAGHSLGEYAALAAAGALGLSDTARLLRIRGEAMQRAVPVGEGAMAALLGLDFKPATELAAKAAQGEVCQAANDNAPGQVVISGAKSAVDRALELAAEFGARRAVLLPVSAPFHCALMQPAADAMAKALDETTVTTPVVPLIANVRAAPISNPEDIKTSLVEQVTGTVRWRESVAFMAGEGIDMVYEIGAGRILSGLARRIARQLSAKSIGSFDEIEKEAAELVE